MPVPWDTLPLTDPCEAIAVMGPSRGLRESSPREEDAGWVGREGMVEVDRGEGLEAELEPERRLLRRQLSQDSRSPPGVRAT